GDYAYSVAEHSLLVERIFCRLAPHATAKQRLTALLHDAPEYVIGDMISPVKAAVGPGYAELDKRLTAAIHIRFGLPAETPTALKRQIKKADNISAWLEATQIAGFSVAEANKFFGRPEQEVIQDLALDLRPPVQVRRNYTDLCDTLMGKIA
ncbi:MAG: HD domain-containing protein, partial [Pseudomonadota bacterium]